MNETFTGLINNAALLLLIGLLYDLLHPDIFRQASPRRSVMVGTVLGALGILLMLTPWQFTAGITFDTRSILLCISGLYFGLLPTVTAAVLTSLFRILQGGTGTLTGVSVIAAAGGIGLLWRRAGRQGRHVYTIRSCFLLGIIVHAVMLLLMLLMPWDTAFPVLKAISLPVLLIYPAATALLGRILHMRVERNKMASDLLKSRRRLQTTLKSIGDAVIATDDMGNIQLMNPVAEELTGWSFPEAENAPLPEIFSVIDEETRKPLEDPFTLLMHNRESELTEQHPLLQNRDGAERIISENAALIRDDEDNMLGLVLVFRDQTEERKNNERLQRNAKLESLGILAGGIAHDFNNLPGGVFGFMELAEQESSEPAVKTYLQHAQEVFSRARDLTRQLLTFSKGGGPVRGDMDVERIVTSTASFTLSGTNIAISYQIAPDLWRCIGDENQIAQVVENIILNARQAMPNGGVITAAMHNMLIKEDEHALLQEGRYVACSISDTGRGIERALLKKIFDPFFTTKNDGNGLGLAISYSILQRHNGLLDVSSTVGTGSCFTFYLPAAEPVAQGEKPPETEGRTLQAVDMNGSTGPEVCEGCSKNALILDDEPYIRKIAAQMLSSLGFTVHETEHGEQAVETAARTKARKEFLDLFFLDLTIPGGKGGTEVVGDLRKLYPDSTYVAVSGYADNPVIADPQSFGFTCSMQKPFTKEQLRVLLQTSSVISSNRL